MQKGVRRSGFSWGIALVVAVLLVLPAFLGSVPAAKAESLPPIEVTAANMGISAHTTYTLEFELQQDQFLNVGDTVYLRTCYIGEDDPGYFNFSNTTATITAAVYSPGYVSTIDRVTTIPSGDPPVGTGLCFTIPEPDEFAAGPGSKVTIELNEVVNPQVSGRQWYWEVGINNADQMLFSSLANPLTISRTGVELKVTYGDGRELDEYSLDLFAGQLQKLTLTLIDQDGNPPKPRQIRGLTSMKNVIRLSNRAQHPTSILKTLY